MEIAVVVPTYWTWPQGTPPRPDDAIYDHPTPLGEPGTLARLLESLRAIPQPKFQVLIITAATHPQLEAEVEAKVEEIIAPFRAAFPIAQFAHRDLRVLHAHMVRAGRDDLAPHISLRGYGNVRNIQLIVPHLLGCEVVVALDDDEVVTPDYLMKAVELIDTPAPDGSGPILGVAGYYLDAQGRKFIQVTSAPDETNPFHGKAALMNAAIARLDAQPGRIVPSMIAFGGNMVFARGLWERVSFDPWITRGEDIDYVLNARLAGFRFWLDKELCITHLPPHEYDTPPYAKLAEDVRRFLYQREKLRWAAAQGYPAPDLAELSPYPGRFLADDIEGHALTALESLATPELEARYGTPEAIVSEAVRRARELAPRYFAFAARWPSLLETLGENRALRQWMTASFDHSGVTP